MNDEPLGITTPEVEPPPRETEPVDVVVGNKVITMRGDEVVAEREIEDAPAPPPAPEPTPEPTPEPQPEDGAQ